VPVSPLLRALPVWIDATTPTSNIVTTYFPKETPPQPPQNAVTQQTLAAAAPPPPATVGTGGSVMASSTIVDGLALLLGGIGAWLLWSRRRKAQPVT